MYISVQETANKWGLSTRRVRALCENKQIKGVTKVQQTLKNLKIQEKRLIILVKLPKTKQF